MQDMDESATLFIKVSPRRRPLISCRLSLSGQSTDHIALLKAQQSHFDTLHDIKLSKMQAVNPNNNHCTESCINRKKAQDMASPRTNKV